MDIFSIFTLFGGLAFFLYGMSVMSSGLEKMTGGSLERALGKMTSNPFSGLALGMGITVAIQSSSALTVMLVGLVNSGIMQFSQTPYMIMGSNIGTTLTAWILSLQGINSENIFIKMLKPTSFSPVVAFIGILFILVSKKHRTKDIGGVMVGFSVLMYGMSLMSDAMSPLADMPEFAGILTAFNNPILGVLVGAVFTGIIQSSAASVGILQALSLTGSISYGMAVPIIMGQNIGTCVTSMISSIGVSKNAKRVAALHVMFNLIGTVICLVIYYAVSAFVEIKAADAAINPGGIAAVHSIFNITTTVILLPFTKYLVKLAEKVVGGESKKHEGVFIDERLLSTPSFAISECSNLTVKMSKTAHETMLMSLGLLDKFDPKAAETVKANEDLLDMYEDKLGSFLVKLSSKNLTNADSQQIAKLLHCIGDYERIGDHALNLCDAADEIREKKIVFSDAANSEIAVAVSALGEILERTASAFENGDVILAGSVEPLEQVIDGLIKQIKANHIDRLQKGHCTIEMGFVLSDILTNIERTSDHCSNIAVAVIEVAQNNFDTHEYLNAVKTMDNEEFRDNYNEFSRKFKLPVM